MNVTSAKGFTLAELLIAISIMAIMSVAAITVLGGQRIAVKSSEVGNVVGSILQAQVVTKARTGSYQTLAQFPAALVSASPTVAVKPVAADRLVAGKLGLELGGTYFGRYACTASSDGQAVSCAGWSDVDATGVGSYKVVIGFLPAFAADGSLSAVGVSATPDAPVLAAEIDGLVVVNVFDADVHAIGVPITASAAGAH